MAEKFAFDEVFGDAAQLILMNGAPARGFGGERAGDEFLAGAALAGDEHGGLVGRLCGSTGAGVPWARSGEQFVAALVFLGALKYSLTLRSWLKFSAFLRVTSNWSLE